MDALLENTKEPLFKRIVKKAIGIVALVILATVTLGIILTLGLSSYHPG